jgi:hypothetical protein
MSTSNRNAGKFTVVHVPGEDNPWRVVWNFPGAAPEHEVISKYSQRQNAYRRCKQLNERNIPPRDLYVRITTERQYCKALRRTIGKFGEMVVRIIDPLDDTQPERRQVEFGIICRFHEENRVNDDYYSFIGQPPLESDVRMWLDALRNEPGVREIETSYHSFLA